MHIAFFSPGWPLESHHNGIVTFVHWMRQELERRGHRVSIFAAMVELTVHDPRVHVIQRHFLGRAARRLARPLFSVNHDILEYGKLIAAGVLEVHGHEPIDIIEMEESFGWAADVGRLTDLPVLVKLHGPAFLSLIDEELTTPIGLQRVIFEGNMLISAQAVSCPSAITLAQTIKKYNLSPGVSQQVVNPLTMPSNTPVWQSNLSDANSILFVGRFDKRKGGDVVLRTFKILAMKFPLLKLIFVGPDSGLLQPNGTKSNFDDYCSTMFSSEVRGRIDFRGRMSNTDISIMRVHAAVTLVASRWENQGYTLLEAMYQGCPVVCSDAGGSPESVIHGFTGLLARSENPDDFAEQVSKLLEDREMAASLGAAARQHVIDNHSSDKVASDSISLYERTIAHDKAVKYLV